MTPAVSIILPTYNRARFLPQALASIGAQRWTDWELIIVDDGSTDDTPGIIGDLTAGIAHPVKFIRQENGGPAIARNTGLDHATGRYVAFFDSDDEWLPDHLHKCVSAFDCHSDIDWIFAASQRIDLVSKKVLTAHSFYSEPTRPRFLKLKTRKIDDLYIIDDPDVRPCAFRGSGFGGLQCTVARRKVFETLRFEPVAFFEDRIVLMRAADMGVRFAYFDTVSTLVYTHDSNVSFANPEVIRNRIASYRLFVTALEKLREELPATRREQRAIDQRLAQECFWSLAYPLMQNGNPEEALSLMRRAIRLCPLNLAFRKTYLATLIKAKLRRVSQVAST